MSKNIISVNVNGTGMVQAEARTFSSGSTGWYGNGKVNIQVGDSRGPLVVTIEGQSIVAEPKPMKEESGNFGWYANGKVTIDGQLVQVGGNITACKCNRVEPLNKTVNCQVGINLTIVGSKPGSTTKPQKKSRQLVAAKVQPAAPVATVETDDQRLARLIHELITSPSVN